MKILVTGGAGYVGSHCVRKLCEAGHEIVVYDNLKKGHQQAVDSKAILVVGDLADSVLLNQTFSQYGFDAVMHFAALAEVNESVQQPLLYYQNNVVNSINLLEVMQKNEVKRFVFSSSCAVYGEPPAVPITEDMPKNPVSPYGRSKLIIEWAMENCAQAWGLGATALRYFNAAGASADGLIGEDHDPESHLIPLVLKVAMGQTENIKIFGEDYPTPDGSCVRDYVHVEDLAAIHCSAIENQPESIFRYYNVGTGRGTSVKEMIEAAREVTGHDIPAISAPRREGDPPELYADPTKAISELGFQPAYTDIQKTIQTAWDWHRKHPDGYASSR